MYNLNYARNVGVLVAGIMALVAPSNAGAAECDYLSYSNSGDDEIIVGTKYNYICGGFYCGWYASSDLAVCVNGTAGYHLDGCNTSTPSGDHVSINTGAGDDTVYTWYAGPDFSCGGVRIGPWRTSGFSFGISAVLGDGEDYFYGTPNDDEVLSNYYHFLNGYVADGDKDVMCGYGGADTLRGNDGDDGDDYECIDGGSGVGDICHGEGGLSSPDDWYNSATCETHLEADHSDAHGDCESACPSTPPSPF